MSFFLSFYVCFFKNAKRASAAAAPLAAWVMANLQYSAILEKILPLEQEKVILTKFVFDLDDSLRFINKILHCQISWWSLVKLTVKFRHFSLL